jgi:hypothetical protein
VHKRAHLSCLLLMLVVFCPFISVSMVDHNLYGIIISNYSSLTMFYLFVTFISTVNGLFVFSLLFYWSIGYVLLTYKIFSYIRDNTLSSCLLQKHIILLLNLVFGCILLVFLFCLSFLFLLILCHLC